MQRNSMAPNRTLDGFSIEIFGLTILLSHHSSSNSADAHKSLIYFAFFLGRKEICLSISVSVLLWRLGSGTLFIYLFFFPFQFMITFFCARPQIQIHECAHTKRAASRDYRYRYNLFLFVCFLLYLFLFYFFFYFFRGQRLKLQSLAS